MIFKVQILKVELRADEIKYYSLFRVLQLFFNSMIFENTSDRSPAIQHLVITTCYVVVVCQRLCLASRLFQQLYEPKNLRKIVFLMNQITRIKRYEKYASSPWRELNLCNINKEENSIIIK